MTAMAYILPAAAAAIAFIWLERRRQKKKKQSGGFPYSRNKKRFHFPPME